MPIRFEFVAQSGRIFSDDVDMVIAPSADGVLGILPKHAPLMALIQPGEVVITKAGSPIKWCCWPVRASPRRTLTRHGPRKPASAPSSG